MKAPIRMRMLARRMLEKDVQAGIVQALRLAGLKVYQTSTHRQKGPSGCDRGIPDVLVCAGAVAPFSYLGLEVKRPGAVAWSSIEQGQAFEAREFALVQSPEEALKVCERWFESLGSDTVRRKCAMVSEALTRNTEVGRDAETT